MEAEEKLKQHFLANTTITNEQFEYVFAHFKLKTFKIGQSLIQTGDVLDCEFLSSKVV